MNELNLNLDMNDLFEKKIILTINIYYIVFYHRFLVLPLPLTSYNCKLPASASFLLVLLYIQLLEVWHVSMIVWTIPLLLLYYCFAAASILGKISTNLDLYQFTLPLFSLTSYIHGSWRWIKKKSKQTSSSSISAHVIGLRCSKKKKKVFKEWVKYWSVGC